MKIDRMEELLTQLEELQAAHKKLLSEYSLVLLERDDLKIALARAKRGFQLVSATLRDIAGRTVGEIAALAERTAKTLENFLDHQNRN